MKPCVPSRRVLASAPYGRSWLIVTSLAVLATAGGYAIPRIGYVYPAGGQVGSSFTVTVGGQGLSDPLGVVVSGEGVSAEVLDHFRLLSAEDRDAIGEKAQEVSARLRQVQSGEKFSREELRAEAKKLMAAEGITEKNLLQLREFSDRLGNPKRQQNSQIGETVTLRVKVAANAVPGLYFCRLLTATGLSNAMRFAIGQHPEAIENDPWPLDVLAFFGAGARFEDVGNIPTDRFDRVNVPLPTQALPVTINGQILPGEVDEFTFRAKAGDKLVVALAARKLVPYLADAVPGWFQAVISLHDSTDQELAFADDFRFDPDPVIFYKIQKDGEYRVKVHDSIYRGREDFVYRLTIGQLPFLTGLYPLGAPAGSELDLNLQGGNLSEHVLKRYKVPDAPGLLDIFATNNSIHSNVIPFHVDTVPEEAEREPNDRRGTLNEVACPGIINGTISKPGDVDFFRVPGNSKGTVLEVFARRLGSPLDASLVAYNDMGKPMAANDDYENPTAGLTTHHADSRLVVTGNGAGSFYVKLADRLGQGSVFHHYRLKVTPLRPTCSLRVTPSSVSARPGGGAAVKFHVLRLDGFKGEVSLRLKDPPPGFTMAACTIPGDKDTFDAYVSVPPRPTEYPVALKFEGTAAVDGKDMVMEAVASEDMMQAFAYRHLVPVDSVLVDVRVPPPQPQKKK